VALFCVRVSTWLGPLIRWAYWKPLVVNTKHQVISGHRRLQAIKQLGWKFVEVIVRNDIPQENEAFYLVQYNQQRIKLASEQLKEILVWNEYMPKPKEF
jgi:ParB-like chromosome segregation protein Spo0J